MKLGKRREKKVPNDVNEEMTRKRRRRRGGERWKRRMLKKQKKSIEEKSKLEELDWRSTQRDRRREVAIRLSALLASPSWLKF